MAKRMPKATPKRRATKKPPTTGALDGPAQQYAKLIADPCNGPLVHGVASDGMGGIVSRFEGDLIVNGSATETAAFIAFVPGTNQYYSSGGLLPADTTSFSLTNATAFNYLASGSNVGSYRCLAACVQVYWPGTENNRSGVISMGQFNVGDITTGSLTTAVIRTGSQYVERTPHSYSELKWTPTAQDLIWNEVNANDTATPALSQKHGALVVSGAGLAVATGLRIRLVAVMEWKPAVQTGLGNQIRVPRSRNTIMDVLRWLESVGYSVYSGAIQAGSTANSVARAVGAMGRVAYGSRRALAIMAS